MCGQGADSNDSAVTSPDSGSPPLFLQPPPTSSHAKRVTFTLQDIVTPIDTDESGYTTATPNSRHRDHTLLSHDSSGDCSQTDLILNETVPMEGEKEDEIIEGEHELPALPRRHSKIMDLIPDEAESLTVLVGGVKFLEQPITAFVRLEQVSIMVVSGAILVKIFLHVHLLTSVNLGLTQKKTI